MLGLIRSEAIKLASTRTTWVYSAVILVGILGMAVAYRGVTPDMTEATLTEVFTGSGLVSMVAIFGGAMFVGADLSRNTIAWSYLSTNKRISQAFIQAFLITALFLIMAIIGGALAVGVYELMGTNVDLQLSNAQSPLAAIIVLTLLAVFLARILGSGVFSALVLVADVFVIELLLFNLSHNDIARKILNLLPFQNLNLLSGQAAPHMTHGVTGAVIILCSTVAAAAIGASLAAHRRAVG